MQEKKLTNRHNFLAKQTTSWKKVISDMLGLSPIHKKYHKNAIFDIWIFDPI